MSIRYKHFLVTKYGHFWKRFIRHLYTTTHSGIGYKEFVNFFVMLEPSQEIELFFKYKR